MFTASRRLLLARSVVMILLSHSPLLLAQELREVTTLNDEKARGNCFAAFAPDGKSLVSVDHYGVVNLWDLETKKSKQRWVNTAIDDRFPSLLNGVLSPDGKSLVTTVTVGKEEDKGAILFELGTGKRLLRFGPKVGSSGGSAYVAAFSPDGKTLVTGNTGGYLILCDVGTAKELARLSTRFLDPDARGAPAVHGEQTIRTVCFSPDGKTLAAADEAGVVSVWDATTRKLIKSWQGHKKLVTCSAFVMDGKSLASGSHDGTVKLWEAATGKEKATLKVGGEVYSLVVSPSGDRLTVGGFVRGSDDLHLFDLKSGEKLVSKTAYRFGVTSVTSSADGKMLATTGGGSNDVKLWQVVSAKDKDK
jgi:WD40 repeat protein